MNRVLGVVLGLGAAGMLGDAGAASVGGFVGTDAGVYYQSGRAANGSAVRYGLTGLGLFSRQVTVAGEAAYLQDFATTAPNTFGTLTPYYGAGVGAGLALGASNAFTVYPHGILGLRYNTATPLSFFGELNAGVSARLGSASSFGFQAGARLGLNYNLGN